MKMRRLFDVASRYSPYLATAMFVVSLGAFALSVGFSIVALRARDEVQRIRAEDIEHNVFKLTKLVIRIEREVNELRSEPQSGVWIGPPQKRRGFK